MHHLCKWKVKGGIKSSKDDVDADYDDIVDDADDDVVDADDDDVLDADDQHHLRKWKGEGGVKSSNLSATRGTHGKRCGEKAGNWDFPNMVTAQLGSMPSLSTGGICPIYPSMPSFIYLMTNYLHDTSELIP